MPQRTDNAAQALEAPHDPNRVRALMIEIASRVIAADLAEPADFATGFGLSADDLNVAVMLAEQEPGNVFAITPAHADEALLLAIETGASILGARYTTPERYRAVCLADRADADDLMDVILTAARQHGAPLAPSRKPSWKDTLPFDVDTVTKQSATDFVDPIIAELLGVHGPSVGRYTPMPKAAPDGAPRASLGCLRGLHHPGPLGRHGWAVCQDCGVTLVTAMPGGAIEVKSGNAHLAVDGGPQAEPFVMPTPTGPSGLPIL
jgi:hypothetical protein